MRNRSAQTGRACVIYGNVPLERFAEPGPAIGPADVDSIYLDGALVWRRGKGRLVPVDQLDGITEVAGVNITEVLS